MTTTAPTSEPHPTLTGDRRPVEHAVADSIAAQFPPETFLHLNFWRPDGGVGVRYAWTTGGAPLGDHIDQRALAAGRDACDWFHIADRHQRISHRGRIEIQAYALRPVLADLQAGERGPEDRREALRRLLRTAGKMTGQSPRTLTPRWLGFGPVLVNRAAGGRR